MGFGVFSFYRFLVFDMEDKERKKSQSATNLSLGGNGRSGGLEVVGLEVALEVEDLELILLREREELAEGGIRLDDLLVHERVVLGVLADTGRHLRAGERRALRNAEEGAELSLIHI